MSVSIVSPMTMVWSVVLPRVDAEALELGGHVAPGALTVVRQEQEGDAVREQLGNEPLRAGNELVAAIDNTVHVNQVTEHGSSPPGRPGKVPKCFASLR